MKTIAPAAMKAIEAGEAIVTGAVEILPRVTVLGPPTIVWSTVGTVNLDARINGAYNGTDGLLRGITVGGFSPTDIVRVTLPPGGVFTAWNYDPLNHANPTPYTSRFNVVPDGHSSFSFAVAGSSGFAATAEAARAAFIEDTFTGASSYTFFCADLYTDNLGGVSILVEKGVSTSGVTVGAGDPIYVWGGYGPIVIEGNTYLGLGDRGLAQQTSGAIGGVAQGMVLTLSGIEPGLLALLDAHELKGAAVIVRRLIFAGDGKTLLDAHVFDRGRGDAVDTDEVVGGAAAIKIAVESAARGLGRSGARMRADSDQRLINPSDGYFRNTAYAGEKMLYWGGKRPSRAASALSSTSGSSSSGGTVGPIGVRA